MHRRYRSGEFERIVHAALCELSNALNGIRVFGIDSEVCAQFTSQVQLALVHVHGDDRIGAGGKRS
ncbi:hypothetical protein D3C87_1809280 [compost metagenome]